MAVSLSTAKANERNQQGRILWSESDCPLCCSCRLPIVILEKSTQSLPASNPSLTLIPLSRWTKQEFVLSALMIALLMIMHYVFLKGSLERSLTEENQLRQTLFFDRLDPSLRK
jgi:hypothetical protein